MSRENPIVYYVGGHYLGCHYVRCHIPALVNGYKTNYKGLARESIKDPHKVMEEMLEADIVVFHRANTNWHHRVGQLLRKAGKKVVFDNDDTYIIDKTHAFYGLDEKGYKQNIKLSNNIINNFILNADYVSCSTETLLEEYRRINKNAVLIPNFVNPEDWDKPLRNKGDKVRIGIVGSVAYYHDFIIVEDVIRKLDKDPRVQLVMFGLQDKKARAKNKLTEKVHKREYGFWDTLENIERVPWTAMSNYFTALNELRLDIMMIPRKDSYFNKCKSNVKFLEASMCEIPVITNLFKGSPYEKDKDYLVEAKDWLKDLEPLIKNKDLRRKLGKKAKKYVLKNYNAWDKVDFYQNIYKQIINNKN